MWRQVPKINQENGTSIWRSFSLCFQKSFWPLKIDIWYVTRQSATSCNFFAKSQKTSPNSFPTHFAPIMQFLNGGKKTADALPSDVVPMLAKWEGEKEGEGERHEKSEKCRLARHRSLERSESRMCSRRRMRHIMKSYERKCRLCIREMRRLKNLPNCHGGTAKWIYGVPRTSIAGCKSSLKSSLPEAKHFRTFPSILDIWRAIYQN